MVGKNWPTYVSSSDRFVPIQWVWQEGVPVARSRRRIDSQIRHCSPSVFKKERLQYMHALDMTLRRSRMNNTGMLDLVKSSITLAKYRDNIHRYIPGKEDTYP